MYNGTKDDSPISLNKTNKLNKTKTKFYHTVYTFILYNIIV